MNEAEQVYHFNLRVITHYVADGVLYSLEGREKVPTLWLTREENNLALRHLNDTVNSSYDQMVKTNFFRPDPEEARVAMHAPGTLRINLTKLRLRGDGSEGKVWGILNINTTTYDDSLNAEERKLAERWYGQGKAFVTAMHVLKQEGIDKTKVFVLPPEVVTTEAATRPFCRVSLRNDFYFGASSQADSPHAEQQGVRGVRRAVIPVGDAPKIPAAPSVAAEVSLADCCDTILNNQKEAVAILNDAGVAWIVKNS